MSLTPFTAGLLALGVGIIGIVFAFILSRIVLREDFGNERVQELSEHIQSGARAFMLSEFRILTVFMIVVAVALYFLPGMEPVTSLGFVMGTIASGLAGWIGMMVATRANGRTAHAAQSSFANALRIAYNGGATMGFSVVGIGLFGLAFLYVLYPDNSFAWLGYAFGSSIVALFLRVGGGIYTKSADVGADIVGKVEAGIPEDDPRNPGVIADNVGDNVGDVAGMGSDLYESYVSAIAATMFLGEQYHEGFGGEVGIYLALVIGASGILASILGSMFVRTGAAAEEDDHETQRAAAQRALNLGTWISNAAFLVLGLGVIFWLVDPAPANQVIAGTYEAGTALDIRWAIFLSILFGLATGMVIGWATEYYTAEYGPVKQIAESSETGAATNIIEGLGTGLISTVIPAIAVAAATMGAYYLAGLYGIAIASLGMLVTLGSVLAMDAYGPITDNAAGIAEMANLGQDVRERCEALDSVGNTTAAIGKGFAIGSAALAALAWLATFFEKADKIAVDGQTLLEMTGTVELMSPAVLVGLLLGSMLTFALAALGIRAVSRGASQVVQEVRRQFEELDGVREGERDPDYERCVEITTAIALKEMMIPGLIVLLVPIIIGSIPFLGIKSLAGLLAGVLFTGFLTAIFMSNAGGAWDNAKKYIESGVHGGKGSPAHKASVIGDTVGDPLKDTSGPSLNVLIKLIGKIAVIFLPLFAWILL